MIESFSEFLEKSYETKIFESNEDSMIETNVIENLKKPDFICDDKYLVKISRILLNALNVFEKDWMVYPYVLNTNNKKSVMVYCDDIYLVLVKEGIEKNIALFHENPINNSVNPYITVSSKKGFLYAVRTIVGFIADGTTGVYEAYKWGEKEKPGAMDKLDNVLTAIMGEGKPGARKSEKAISRDSVKQFLELFKDNDDRTITMMMCEDWFDEEDPLAPIQKLYARTDGTLPVTELVGGKVDSSILNAQARITKLFRMALCGVTTGCLPDVQKRLKELWFFGAAKSGSLAIEVTSDDILIVTESTDEMDRAIEKLELAFDDEEEIVTTMLKYVQSGGEVSIADELSGWIGDNRCLLVPGVAGIGKTEGIKRAIDKTRAKEGIDYYEVPSVTTAIQLYKQLYRYNDMILIFEEAEKLLQDKDIANLMKRALDPAARNREIGTPGAGGANASAGGRSNEYYDTLGKTRRERYYLEVGSVSEYDKKQKFKAEKKRLEDEDLKRYRAVLGTDDERPKRSMKSIEDEAQAIVDEWEENQRKSQFPVKFFYNGYWIITTNKTIRSFKNDSKLSDNWEALSSRCYKINVNPKQKVIWEWLKKKIKESAENPDLDDRQRIIPIEGRAENATLKNVVDYIQAIMDGSFNSNNEYYGFINFRVLNNIKKIIDSPENTEKKWKRLVLQMMLIDADDE